MRGLPWSSVPWAFLIYEQEIPRPGQLLRGDGRLQKRADRSFMRFIKEKCLVLHLWRSNPGLPVLQTRPWGPQWTLGGHEPAMWACCKGSWYSGLPLAKHWQQVKEADPSTLLSTGESTPGVLDSVLDAAVQENYGYIRGTEKIHKDVWGNRGSHMRGKVERVEAVQLGEEKAQGRPHHSLWLPQVRQQRQHGDPLSGHYQYNTRKWNRAVSGEVQIRHEEKILHWEGGWALEEALQGSGCSTMPYWLQGASGLHS